MRVSIELDSEIIQKYNKSSQNFKADNVLIHGDRVYVNGKKGESDYTLISYTAIGTTVEFPTCYTSNLNIRLESPLKSSLVRGSNVRFEILYNTEQIFRIYYKNYQNGFRSDISTEDFTKSGNTYSLETVISSTTYLQLFIGYKINNDYEDLYSFNLVDS